tara:strand:+ start:206 stop:502 length:297 start_codon:yes stop_codon:yes gene_type:complete
MVNLTHHILKLKKIIIHGYPYAIDMNNKELYDYELALKGIPIKIGILSYNPKRIILFDDSTGKTLTNNYTGKTITQKGGIMKYKKTRKTRKFRKSKRK